LKYKKYNYLLLPDMKFSILHISDLHRDLNDEVSNEWLLDSLSRDFAQFDSQDPKIMKPSICIVSGDLIHGVSSHTKDPEKELLRQYHQAEEFLIGLSDRFFDGNRDCVVILPGNHDVNFDDVIKSIRKIEIPDNPEEKRHLVEELFKPNSKMRWSWKDLCFFEIIDTPKYNERFRFFAGMYENFYRKHRNFSHNAEQQYDIFDFPKYGFCIATLNSCLNNDPFHTAGAFHPVAIAEACRKLQKIERYGWLTAAAWHHNIFAGPTQNDFLFSGFIQPLIDAGVSLGFHGHQNRSDCFDERYRFGPIPRKMTIVSASTLCAEPKNLVPGVPRSYNIIEIDTINWNGRVHQRQMVNAQFNMPLWGPGHFINTNTSFFDFKLCPPLKSRPNNLNLQMTLEQVDKLIGSRQWHEALTLLEPVKNLSEARPFLLRALEELGNGRQTIVTLWPPETNREIIVIGGAILECGTRKEAEDFIKLKIVSTNVDASVQDMRQRVSLRCQVQK
jgi:hypothetical protein